MVTLGHHYSRSFTHVHYLESLSKVNYRYNKKFSLKYTNLNNKISKKGVVIPIHKEIYNPVLEKLKEFGIEFIEE